MGMNKTPIGIELTAEEREELERLSRAQRVPHRMVVRARTILRLATGKPLSAVAREVGRQRRIVRKWAVRFVRKRLRGLDDAPRSGRPPRFSPRRGDVPDQVGL